MSVAELKLELYRQIDTLDYEQLLKLKVEIDFIIQSNSLNKSLKD